MSNVQAERGTAVPPANTLSSTPRRPLARALARALPGAMLLSAGLVLSPAVLADTYTVLNTADTGAGSLRNALEQANANPGSDSVTFNSTVTGSINLTTGPLYITDSVDVQGPGAGTLTVNGSGIVATPLQGNGSQVPRANVFIIGALGPATLSTIQTARATRGGPPNPPPAIDVTLSGLTVSGGQSYAGGGILAAATKLSINACTVTGNTAYQAGGGIAALAKYGVGSLAIADSVISNNTVDPSDGPATGGGVFVMGGTTEVIGSTISNNTAVVGGGLMATPNKYQGGGGVGNLMISDSTISGNEAVTGTSYYFGANLTRKNLGSPGGSAGAAAGLGSIGNQVSISNSTISGNSSDGIGGGMVLDTKYGGGAIISNSTVAGNQADYQGGGIVFYASGGTSVTPQIRNSVIGGNSAASGSDLAVAASSGPPGNGPQGTPSIGFDLAYTLVQSANPADIIDSGGNILNQAPMLGALANNGGPTMTQLPLAGSPLIDAGDPAFSGPPNDQRGTGFPRIVNSAVDIGATEYAAAAPPAPSGFIAVPGLGDAGKLGLGALLGLAGLAVARRRRKLAPVRK